MRAVAATILVLFLLTPAQASPAYPVAARPFLTQDQRTLLEEMLRIHLQYFLSSAIVTASGLPMGGFKESDPYRFNYSNPAEWGYTMQAWIAAADRGLISATEAAGRIQTMLNTLVGLQADDTQHYRKLFYPYYYVRNRSSGADYALPKHDTNHDIPSIDNALLYTSLVIVEGWARSKGLSAIESLARNVSGQMDFRVFLDPTRRFFAHVVSADRSVAGASRWNVYADEGGVMAWVAFLSGSVSLDEYRRLVRSLKRPVRTWGGVTVDEAPYFSAMFAWSVRSLAGFPVATWETGITSEFSSRSFAPAVQGHLAYGASQGAHYPAYSDVMTQGWIGRCTPPNIDNQASVQPHAVPHALFVPLCIGPDLEPQVLSTLVGRIADLRTDAGGYYHDGQDQHAAFGFEAAASVQRHDVSYGGIGAEGRYTYETLSHAYTVLSLQQGLAIHDGAATWLHHASQVSGYADKVAAALAVLYRIRRVPRDHATIQAAVDASAAGDTIIVDAGTFTESVTMNKGGVVVVSGGHDSVLQGPAGEPAIRCSGSAGAGGALVGFTIRGGAGSPTALRAAPTASAWAIEGNRIEGAGGSPSGMGVELEAGASATVVGNHFWNCGLGTASLGCQVEFVGNTMATSGPNLAGILLHGAIATIRGNDFEARWDGAVVADSGADVLIEANSFNGVFGWNGSAVVGAIDSTLVVRNNRIRHARVYNSTATAAGIEARQSVVSIHNNVFHDLAGAGPSARGVALHLSGPARSVKNNVFSAIGSGAEAIWFEGAGEQEFSWNDLWGITTTAETTGVAVGAGNIARDPLWRDTVEFLPGVGSPCVDTGDPGTSWNDLNGTRNDLGAHGGPFGRLIASPRIPATLSLLTADLEQVFDGTPRTVRATTSPAGLSGVHVSYDGSQTAPTSGGSYAVVAWLESQAHEASLVTGRLVVTNPAPTLGGISPSRRVAGRGDFTLTVRGGQFVAGARVFWGGVALTTVVDDSTRVRGAVPAALVASPGTASVVVRNPEPATAASAAVVFAIVPPFTDDPLTAGLTPVRAAHIEELRARIGELRLEQGLPPYPWTDSTLVAGATRVKAAHMEELRAALGDVYAARGLPLPSYTDPALVAHTTPIAVVHLAEIRAAILALWQLSKSLPE